MTSTISRIQALVAAGLIVRFDMHGVGVSDGNHHCHSVANEWSRSTGEITEEQTERVLSQAEAYVAARDAQLTKAAV